MKITDVKARDSVTIMDRGPMSITTVERLTQTLIFTTRGGKWRRTSGHQSPRSTNAWSSRYIVPTTDEHRTLMQHRRNVAALRAAVDGTRKLTNDQVARIAQIVREQA